MPHYKRPKDIKECKSIPEQNQKEYKKLLQSMMSEQLIPLSCKQMAGLCKFEQECCQSILEYFQKQNSVESIPSTSPTLWKLSGQNDTCIPDETKRLNELSKALTVFHYNTDRTIDSGLFFLCLYDIDHPKSPNQNPTKDQFLDNILYSSFVNNFILGLRSILEYNTDSITLSTMLLRYSPESVSEKMDFDLYCRIHHKDLKEISARSRQENLQSAKHFHIAYRAKLLNRTKQLSASCQEFKQHRNKTIAHADRIFSLEPDKLTPIFYTKFKSAIDDLNGLVDDITIFLNQGHHCRSWEAAEIAAKHLYDSLQAN